MSLTFAIQALLARHEAYIAEATEERRKMGGSIEKLENDKKELQASNTRVIEENRYLLDQLEEMNDAVSNSDSQILSLNGTLESTRIELERLALLAGQASHLEAQLSALEMEEADLHRQLASREEEKRTAVQRWQGAERTINTLQEQVDQIDKEAREDRLRHAEVVKRFERRRTVERELETAAGRLKGAAAAATKSKDGSNNVVSHFVKDILQDNANLQLGIVELRELLMGSNEEVESLREQMILHQSVQPHAERPGSGEDLSSELARTSINDNGLSPDFHVHHHYHAAPKVKTARERSVGLAKTKKRRNVTTPGLRTPSSGTQTPRTPQRSSTHSIEYGPDLSATTILSQTSVTIPPVQSHRWSSQSLQAPPSLPGSPQSAFRYPSVFDNIDDNACSSRPTTPGSTARGSPPIYPRHHKRNSDVSARSLSTQTTPSVPQSRSGTMQVGDRHSIDDPTESSTQNPLRDRSTIPEEPEDDTRISFLDNHFDLLKRHAQRLPRASSHESLLSPARGLDVPNKLRTKRSQGFHPPRSSLGPSNPSIGPVTSSTAAVVSKRPPPPPPLRGYDSGTYNRLLLHHAHHHASSSSSSLSTSGPAAAMEGKSTLGRRVGGWVFGKWGVGVAPTGKSIANLKAVDALSAAIVEEGRFADGRDKKTGDGAGGGRSVSGGGGGGTKAEREKRLSTHVEAVGVDERLLRESLVDG